MPTQVKDDFIPDSHDDFQPDEVKPEEKKQSWYDWATIPLTNLPSELANSVADFIDSPSLDRSPMAARLQGFGAGALQGLGDLVTNETTPLALGLDALAYGPKSVLKGAAKLTSPLIENAGKILQYGPLRGRILGRTLEYAGSKMRDISEGVKDLERYMPNTSPEKEMPKIFRNNEPMKFERSPVGKYEPNISGYKSQVLEESNPLNFRKSILTNEDLADPDAYNISTYKVIRNDVPNPAKLKVRMNLDGTFTNMENGELLDKNFNPIVEINKKPIDRNSSFFLKNRQ